MLPKFDVLTLEEVGCVHDQAVKILEEVGVEFSYQPALQVFQKAGLQVVGNRVYFTKAFLEEILKNVPSSFTLHARNPEKNLVCGGDHVIFMPGYGAPFVQEADGTRRESTMQDYDNFVKLAGASPNMHMTGGNVVEPNDVEEDIRHLRMIYSHIVNSDKCFMGSSSGKKRANDDIEIAALLFGGRDVIKEKPVMISLINSITPLKYDNRMLGALMTYAAAGQPVIIASLVMAGTTGPVTLAGALALQNAEVLAGIALTQCVNPGTPVVYGSTSAIADMSEAMLSIGNPECALLTAASAQMARFYNIPCRGGGALSDSKLADNQAGFESMMTLLSAGISGINFVLHSAGILEFYNAMSYEKFILDDEIAGMVLRYLSGIRFSEETLAFDLIKKIGPGGHFLLEDHTLLNFRKEQRLTKLCDRRAYGVWADTSMDSLQRAKKKWGTILAEYRAPELDPFIHAKIRIFIENRIKQIRMPVLHNTIRIKFTERSRYRIQRKKIPAGMH